MTWAYLPDLETASASAEAPEGWIWDSVSLSLAFPLAAGLKSKNTPETPSSPASAPGISHPRRSGPTCAPSMPDPGPAGSTPCLRDTPASHSAPPASGSVRTTSGTCGPRSPDAPASLAPASNGSSSKTSPGMSASALKPCCESFETWASRLRLAYSQRAKLARRMKGSGSSSWLTPDVPNGGRTLSPDVSSTGMTPDGKKRQVGLQNQAIREVANWGTPSHSDGRRGGPGSPMG